MFFNKNHQNIKKINKTHTYRHPNPNPNAMCRVSRSESDGRARLEPSAALRARRFRLCIQSFNADSGDLRIFVFEIVAPDSAGELYLDCSI